MEHGVNGVLALPLNDLRNELGEQWREAVQRFFASPRRLAFSVFAIVMVSAVLSGVAVAEALDFLAEAWAYHTVERTSTPYCIG